MEKTSRWWDLPSAFLLLIATLFSAWRLQTTDWTEGLAHVRTLAILGLLVGLALGQSQFKKRNVVLLSIGYMRYFSSGNGKRKMKMVGSVMIPQSAFVAVLQTRND